MDVVKFSFIAFILSILLFSLPAFANDFGNAPPNFTWEGNQIVPMDMHTVDLSIIFDTNLETAKATAVVRFETKQTGYPMFDMVPEPTLSFLDNTALVSSEFVTINGPQGSTRFRVLKQNIAPGTTHTMTIEYELRPRDLTFDNGTIRSGFFMNDLATTGREFFEQYGPANFEFDAVKYTFNISVVGTDKEHEVFTNGAASKLGTNEWHIEFADYFTTSSLYFHIANRGHFKTKTYTFEGIEKSFPVTIYSKSSSLVADGVTASRGVLAELEETYGAFAHDRVVTFITIGGGGMEHCGATMTSLWALEHEFTHFWFARGVMPANGNSGWVDEAIASWRDDEYPRAFGAPNRSPVNMSQFSPYRRHTSRLAYTKGAQLISELDYMFADIGGMKPILRNFYNQEKRHTFSFQFFRNFLESASGTNLTDIFNRYVLGNNSLVGFQVLQPESLENYKSTSKHPRPYTADEIRQYR